jgi:pyruvate/2-oxoglutarate dehydrogenase complex dihydrolipoamide acyltransferase (E2) component
MYLLKKALSNPLKWKENLGTVAFTTLGMIIRNRRMYPVPIGPYSCMLAAGSSYHEKVDGKSISKWCMVLNLDHNIIDGAPAVRFGKTFMALVEKGLPEE